MDCHFHRLRGIHNGEENNRFICTTGFQPVPVRRTAFQPVDHTGMLETCPTITTDQKSVLRSLRREPLPTAKRFAFANPPKEARSTGKRADYLRMSRRRMRSRYRFGSTFSDNPTAGADGSPSSANRAGRRGRACGNAGARSKRLPVSSTGRLGFRESRYRPAPDDTPQSVLSSALW